MRARENQRLLGDSQQGDQRVKKWGLGALDTSFLN
jgi:hypothetical protein